MFHGFERDAYPTHGAIVKALGNWTIEGLLDGRPEALRLFQAVHAVIESIGPVTVEVAKTQVSFGTSRKFAWVWLPQMWVRGNPENSITLTFALRRRVEHPRIKETVEPHHGRWTHHVVLGSESDLDDNVREWLREAYAVSKLGRSPTHDSPGLGDD